MARRAAFARALVGVFRRRDAREGCRDFEDRVGVTSARRGAKRDMIRDAVSRLPNRFRYADLERALPAVSRPTIARALRELRAEGAIRCLNPGRDATWEKTR